MSRSSFIMPLLLSSALLSFPVISVACEGLEEGFDRSECLLEEQGPDAYFAYVTEYYSQVKDDAARHDPRLGFRFLENVVRYDRPNLGGLASDIYAWGLSADSVKPYKELVEREAVYLTPLLNEEEKDELEKQLEQNDPEVYDFIRGFWNTREILLSNDVNERLLEHWERIDYAQEHFTEEENTVYKTDDRGEIYVRLGEPNSKRTGKVGHSTTEVRAKLYDLQTKGHIPEGATTQIFNLKQHIVSSVIPAGFELWKYYDISGVDRQSVFFLFGEDEGIGKFGLRNSVEEFIPGTVFSRSAFGRRGTGADLRIGDFLQFVYYNDLSVYDSFFGNRLQEYDRNWHRSVDFGRMNGRTLRSRNSKHAARLATREIYNKAPGDTSTYERRLGDYEIFRNDYRFLDDQHNPEWVTVISAEPGPLYSEIKQEPVFANAHDIHVKQGVVHYDENNHIIERNIYHIERILTTEDIPTNSPVTAHHVRSGNTPGKHATAFSELYFSPQGSDASSQNWSIIGQNKNRIAVGYLDDGPSDELKLSDILLGSPGRDTISVKGETIGVVPENKLTEGEHLQLYFEAYNFSESAEISNYRVEYKITSAGGSWWWPFSVDPERSLTFQSSTEAWKDVQYFEVAPDEMEPGNYSLRITVTEEETGRQASREIDFSVVASDSEQDLITKDS